MTLYMLAIWITTSAWSEVVLTIGVAAMVLMLLMYLLAERKHERSMAVAYIDPDDPEPDMTLSSIKAEWVQLRKRARTWMGWFYIILAVMMTYIGLMAAASHYLR